MKTIKSPRRSVSPFGVLEAEKDIFDQLEEALNEQFDAVVPTSPKELKILSDSLNLPALLQKAYNAPANDAPFLAGVCEYVIKMKTELQDMGVFGYVLGGLSKVFEQKTELFLIDHHNKEQCEALGWEEDYRDVVLFAPERDLLVGAFFEPISKDEPALFSKFIDDWVNSQSMDRILHFLDFAKGSKNPTFEHYLVFSHAALSRILRDKKRLRELLKNAKPLLGKMSSPTWEKNILKALEL